MFTALITSRRFAPLFWCQFLSALNDNFVKNALVILILAPLVYLPSVFAMTIFGNVPMNNRLESLDYTSAQAGAYWSEYGQKWTRLNHIRSIGSVLTAALYIVAAITLITSGQVQS